MSKKKTTTIGDREYQQWIAARLAELRKRLTMMEQASSGDLAYRKVQVRSYTVREHEVHSHSRFYLVKRPAPATSKKAK